MSKPNISPPPFLSFLLTLFLLNSTFTSAQYTGEADGEKQGQTVVSADNDGTTSHVPPPPGSNPAQAGPKPIIAGLDDSLAIACIVVSISLIVVISMLVYAWHRRRLLRRARAPPRSLDKVALVDRKAFRSSVDGQELPLPSPQRKLERTETEVSFASEVTVMDQIQKPQPVFHAI